MMKKFKQVIATMLFFALLIECGKFFRYILTDDTMSYTRITFHEMYEQENIDVLFVGSSHCYRSFVPEIFNSELGLNTFNGGTSSQHLDGSYMVIKEAARYNDIKHIYLELYFDISFAKRENRLDLTQTYIISDYLRPSWDKFQYLLNASREEFYPNSFIVARRNWLNFFNSDYVKNVLAKKMSDAYKEYEYIVYQSDTYTGKGYVAGKETVEDWNYFFSFPSDYDNLDFNNKITDDWRNTLKEIIAFCDKRGISLTLIVAPMSNFLLADIDNYDEYVGLVQDLIEGTGVDYYDFNLCKESYFPNASYLFADEDHLNYSGAEVLSSLLADFITGNIDENDLFYNSYCEKIENLEPTVFGVSYQDEKNGDGETERKCKVVSTSCDELEYRIDFLAGEGELYRVQDFSSNRTFVVAPTEHGAFTIAYRLCSNPDEIWYRYITY